MKYLLFIIIGLSVETIGPFNTRKQCEDIKEKSKKIAEIYYPGLDFKMECRKVRL